MRIITIVCLASSLIGIIGCQGAKPQRGGEGEAPAALPMEGATRAPVIDPTATGTISGSVLFEGTPPPPTKIALTGFEPCAKKHPGKKTDDDALINNGKVQNVFVYIRSGLESYSFPLPAEPALLDQSGCLYTPRVLGLQVEQVLAIRNSDALMHNVHAQPQKMSSGFNIGMAIEGQTIKKTFAEPEVMVPFRCDVHPWMKAFVGVLPHPYFAVTGPDGDFTLTNVPPGTYTIEAWHERFGRQTVQVVLGSKEQKTVSFQFR